MKSGIWVLDHDTGYRNIKKDLVGRYGQETVQQIWEKAGANWEELCARYAHLPEKMKQHTDGQMFRMAAVYMALKEIFPEQALEILGAGVEKEYKGLMAVTAVAGVMLFLVFTSLIGVCAGEEMRCNVTKYWGMGAAALTVASSLINVLSGREGQIPV